MSDPRIGLALGGGAARGIAHIQILHAFDELGIKPHRMSGTSIGALVGAGYAGGLSAAEIEDHSRMVLSNRLDAARRAFSSGRGGLMDLINFNPLASPILEGLQLVKLVLPAAVPDDLAKFSIPLTIVTTDFYNMSEVTFSSGDPVPAIAASIAIPGVISAPKRNTTLIDGGCVNPVPISHLQADCDIVAGVNVIGKPRPSSGSAARTTDLLSGAMQIQQQKIARLQRESLRCDIWIEPAISQFRIHDFFRFEDIMSAARPARDEIKRALEFALNKRATPDT
ncbi:MAG: patatin-like phospholipase family protein [Pseudomonadota bacterium]